MCVDEDDQDIRLQKFRPHKEELIKRHATRGMKIMDMMEESPNGYTLVADAPERIDEAIEYYSKQLRTFTVDFPEEFGICHFKLGQLFAKSIPPEDCSDAASVKIENAVFHCKKALDIFTQDSHPIMWAVVCISLGQFFRRRVEMMSDRSFLASRAGVRDTIRDGLDALNGTLIIFQQAKPYCIEHAICNQELGFLYLKDLEYCIDQDLKKNKDPGSPVNKEVEPGHIRQTKELSISHLERAVSITEGIPNAKPGFKPRTWDPLDQSTHPPHIKTLLNDHTISYFEGVCIYLIGRAYYDCNAMSTIEAYEQELKRRKFMRDLLLNQLHANDDGSDSEVEPDEEEEALVAQMMEERAPKKGDIYDPDEEVLNEDGELDKETFLTPKTDIQRCYTYLIKSLSNRYLVRDSAYWTDAHDKVATIVLNNPRLVNLDYQKPGVPDNDIHIVSVISHLQAAVKSPHADYSEMQMDLHFRCAQCNIYRVYLVTDRVPPGESISQAFAKSFDATSILLAVEKHMLYARQFVTAANNQSTKDAYAFFYSCLKLAEYKMLYSGIIDDATIAQRELIFQQSVYYVLEALLARPLFDNQDLHYCTLVQLCQMLMAARKKHVAVLAYGRLLITLSTIVNRSVYSPVNENKKLTDEIYRQSGHLLYAAASTVQWEQLHAGPTTKPTTGGPPPEHEAPIVNLTTHNLMHTAKAMSKGGSVSTMPASTAVRYNHEAASLQYKYKEQVLLSTPGGRDGKAVWSFEAKPLDYVAVQHSAAIRLMRYQKWKEYEDGVRHALVLKRKEQKVSAFMDRQDQLARQKMREANPDDSSSSEDENNFKVKKRPVAPLVPKLPDLPSVAVAERSTVPPQGVPLKLHKAIVAHTVETVGGDPNFSAQSSVTGAGGPPNLMLGNGESPAAHLMIGDASHQAGAGARVKFKKPIPPPDYLKDDDYQNLTSSDEDTIDDVTSQNIEKHLASNPHGINSKNAQEALEPTYYKTELGGIIAGAASDRGPYVYRKRRLLKISDDTGDVFPSPEYAIAKEAVKKLMEEPWDTGVDKSVFADLSNNMHKLTHHEPEKPKQKVNVNMMTAYEIQKKQENLYRGGNNTDSDDESESDSNDDGSEEGEADSYEDLSDDDDDDDDDSGRSDDSPKKRRRKKPSRKANEAGFVSKFFGLFRRNSGKVAADKYASNSPKKLRFKKKKEEWVPFEQRMVGQAVAGIKGIVKLKEYVTGKVTETIVGKKPPRILGQIWGSKNAFLYWSVMARVQRLHLILRTDRLRTQEGARARAILAEAITVADKKLAREYKILQRKMQIICRNLVIPPANLRELSNRSLADLKSLFCSQTAMARMLFDYEVMLFKNLKGSLAMKFANPKVAEGISKYDYFLPLISCCQTLSKNIMKVGQVCDVAVENISVFDPNDGEFKEEDAVVQDSQKFKKSSLTAGKHKRETIGAITTDSDSEDSDEVPMMPKMFVDTAAWKPGQAPTLKKSGKDTRIVGKVSVEFAQALDGSLDGIRAFFNHHLKSDECIISWHLPVMPNQPLQCVIAWRDSIPHDDKERKKFTQFGKSAPPMPTTREKQRSTSRSFSSYASTAAFAAAEREKIAEEKRQNTENAAHGIVSGVIIEAGQSEADSMQVHYHIQQWLDALHARPAPRRVTMCTEALRNLSDCLSIGELLLMIPSHVSALIFCGPPVIRLIPWHLLFIEIERDFVLTDEEIQAREDAIVEERRKQIEEKRFREEEKLAKIRRKAGPVNEDDDDEPVMTIEEAAAPRPAPVDGEGDKVASEAEIRQKVRDDGQEKPPVLLEVPLCERFSVRMGPTLPLLEITSAAMKNIRHVHGNHHMCCINGSPIVKFGSKAVNADMGTSDEGHLGHTMDDDAVKFATLELETVSTAWSADPDDSYTMRGIASAPEAWRTIPLNRAEIIDHIGEYIPDEKVLKKRALKKLAHKKAKALRDAKNEAFFKKVSLVEIPGEANDKKKKRSLKTNSKSKKGKGIDMDDVPLPEELSSSDESDEDYEFTNDPAISYINAGQPSLDICRVLHICATQIPREKVDSSMLTQEELDKKKSEPIPFAELSLPASKSKFFERKRRAQPEGVNSATVHSGLTSKHIVQQMYLRNCALAVLSRFGPTDDVWDVKDSESNFEFIESVHLAGACCVMYPLWGGLTCGALGILANTLMMIKFYTDLSNYANSRQPIADASRGAQLWLRDANARDIIAYLNNTPLLDSTRNELIEQLQAYLNPVPVKKSFGQVNPNISATDLGDRRLFSHFLFWGSFVVSGTTGAVHIPELVQADVTDAQLAAELNDDGALDIEFERDILKLEGKEEEAKLLTNQIRQNRIDAVKNSIFNLKKSTAPLRKAIDDKIKEFDKLFLDQDSDSIEISESDRCVVCVSMLCMLVDS